MNINAIANEVFNNAVDKGFHGEQEVPGTNQFTLWWEQQINNLHDEVSELHESVRTGEAFCQCDKPISLTYAEEEYADIIIRCLDQMTRLGIDPERCVQIKHEYNKTRPFKHGKKF